MVTFFMPNLNVEIKAKCVDAGSVRNWLLNHHAEFKGIDYQTDTYFDVAHGRLKLREGNIENNLIYYERDNESGPKNSHFQLLHVINPTELKAVLAKSCGIKIIIFKKREIYYINNVKFHIDELPELGSFIEIEAGNLIADKSQSELLEQCNYYLQQLGINEKDLISISYSDMMMKNDKIT